MDPFSLILGLIGTGVTAAMSGAGNSPTPEQPKPERRPFAQVGQGAERAGMARALGVQDPGAQRVDMGPVQLASVRR